MVALEKKPNFTGVTALSVGFVLAGGRSSRMGSNKALLELCGETLIVRAAKLVESVTGRATVVGFAPEYSALGLSAVADDWPGAGPLGGIATALRVSKEPWCLVVACDMPYLTREWLEYLVGRAGTTRADAVVPIGERGAEPLCAMYHKQCEGTVRAALGRGVRKVRDALGMLSIEAIEQSEWERFDPDGLLFRNMNTPADYQEAKARLEGRSRR